jgi:hypothetical protein
MRFLERLLRTPWARTRTHRRGHEEAERLWADLPELDVFRTWHSNHDAHPGCPRCGNRITRPRPLLDTSDPRRVVTCPRCDLPLHRTYAVTAAAHPTAYDPSLPPPVAARTHHRGR